MDKEVVRLLRSIDERLARLEVLARAQAIEDGYEVGCPACGSANLIEASAMGDERVVCGDCNAVLRKEAVNG